MYLAHCVTTENSSSETHECEVSRHVSFYCVESSPAEMIYLLMRYQKHKQKTNPTFSVQPLSMTDLGKAISRTTIDKLKVTELSREIIHRMENPAPETQE